MFTPQMSTPDTDFLSTCVVGKIDRDIWDDVLGRLCSFPSSLKSITLPISWIFLFETLFWASGISRLDNFFFISVHYTVVYPEVSVVQIS